MFAQAARELTPLTRAIEGFEDLYAIEASATEVALVILGDDVDVSNRVATEVGSPWMAAHVVRLLAGPPDRPAGPRRRRLALPCEASPNPREAKPQ
ncbi:MAG TPA: hypothetical protein VG346_13605 [Acidimicrobiales bacterium]|nr:hypothetical protein [Acidimicrobiales bacterium]